MTAKGKHSGPTIPQMVALLDNPEFRSDALQVLDRFRLLNEAAPTEDEWNRRFPRYANKHVTPFVKQWGVLPPTDRELVEGEPWKEVAFCVLTGRWGLIPIFPWTGEQDITKHTAKIRRAIGKIHRDAEGRRRAMLARWLRMHPSTQGKAPRAEIATAVWGRQDGLRRPSRSQAIRKLSEDDEGRLLNHYIIHLGLSHGKASRRLYKRARGSEAPAVSMVRVAESRWQQAKAEFNQVLASPARFDDTGYLLTMLLREILRTKATKANIFKQAAQFRDHLFKNFARG